ncbi:MAG: patatin-like phospholipase family protein [Candidatus Caldatribacteriota bacterium]|nr:patatin-like phospholipase family protein [Candidatus Caldatribacteriota bacterium]
MQQTESKKIALVMGSGGARGYAHIGALKALYEAGVSVDFIVGTSFGSLIGAAFSTGRNVYEMEKIALEYGWKKIIKMIDFGFPRGIIAGNKMESFFSFLFKQKQFSELDIPLTVVTANINTGEEVLINNGLVSEAVLASSALPGIFAPIRYNNQWLADGALVNPLPIQTALDLGAEMVIAIDVSSPIRSVNYLNGIKRCSHGLLKNVCQIPYVNSVVSPIKISKKLRHIIPEGFYTAADGLRIRENNEERINFITDNKNVVLVKPKVENIHWRDFHRVQKCIDLGVEAITDSVARDIKKLSVNL